MKMLRFALHICGHPFDGFWDMKHEKRGKLFFSFLMIILVIVTNVVNKKQLAFLFNDAQYQRLDLLSVISSILIVYLLFCIANWSITTLMDGEGKFSDILMAVGYACLPIPLIQIPTAIISNIATYSESVYINALYIFSIVWFAFLLFTGLMTIHQYGFIKTVYTFVLTAVAMVCIVFLYLLFTHLFSQMLSFVISIYKELKFR